MKNCCLKFIGSLFLFFISSAQAQEWTKELRPNSSFTDIQKAFYDHFTEDQTIITGAETQENEEYLNFKRWENFMRNRLDSTGHFPSEKLWNEWSNARSQKIIQTCNVSNWTLLGPVSIPGHGGGMGRINTIEFEPGNTNTIWVGAANGGLWKSTNGGNTWSTNTDFLPSIGIADIAIDPVNTNNMYIATGDGFGYETGNTFWGGTYTSGIMKSTDGGNTWSPTGFSYSQNSGNIVQRMVIQKTDPQLLLAAARNGLWRSADGGTTWNTVLAQHVYDIEFNPGNDSVIYCSGAQHVFRSLDAGATWTQMPSPIGSGGRISIAVTPADTASIYALDEAGELFHSSNGGISFSYISTPPNITFYGYYDIALAASPTNANTICVGGLQIKGSNDGGTSWVSLGDWTGWPNSTYVHADNHALEYLPGNGTTLFSCDDGGIFKSTNGGNDWVNLSNGITICQYYRLGGSANDPSIIYLGQQDNGSVRKSGNAFDLMLLADGMESVVDFTNSNNVIVTSQNGYMNKSSNGGSSWANVTPSPTGSWTIPIAMDANDPYHLLAGYEDVYESTDGGYNWGKITFNLFNGNTIDEIAIAASNTSYIYAGTVVQLKRSSDGGGSWTNITSGLPIGTKNITSIVVSDLDPLKVWVTISGYTSGQKVYATIDGGTTWTNYSGSLPNVPADAITRVNNSNDELYVGTDFGVYYRNANMSDWVPFNNNLPNVIVDELEINYASNTIRAATYGRGLWESPLQNFTGIQEHKIKDEWNVFPNPSKGIININGSLNDLKKVSVKNVLGEEVYVSAETNFASSGNLFAIDLSSHPVGIYFVEMESANDRMVKKIVLSR